MNIEKIYTSKLPYDVTSWCKEKTDSVVKQLANLVQVSYSMELNPHDRETLNFFLYLALSDSTKLMAFSNGVTWEPNHTDLIADNGLDGYEELKFRYGLLDKTSKQRKTEDLSQIVLKLYEYLSGEVAPNRTFIYELLSTSKYSDPAFEDIQDKLEEVTMGNLAWDNFCVYARIRVKDLEDRIKKI